LLVVLLIVAPSSQQLEPPAIPARFRTQTGLLSGNFSSIAFGPDGRLILIGEKGLSHEGAAITKGGIPVLIDGLAGKELLSLPATGLWVTSSALSPDGRTIAIGTGSGRVLLEDAVRGGVKATLDGHTSLVLSVAFSSDGLTLASTSVDESVRLWDVATGKALTVLPGEGYYYSVAFNRESNALITGSADKTAKIWPVLPRGQALIDLACARVPWPLSEEQRQRLGISEEWCTPEVAAALRTKLGLGNLAADHPSTDTLDRQRRG
jgi:WD40 repeat protein